MAGDANYRDYACRTLPPRLFRVQLLEANTVVNGTIGDIMSGYCSKNNCTTANFSHITEFIQAVKCHWNWSCRQYKSEGGTRFVSTFSDAGSARNWARTVRGPEGLYTIRFYDIDTTKLGGVPVFSSNHLANVFDSDYKYGFCEYLVLGSIPEASIVSEIKGFDSFADYAESILRLSLRWGEEDHGSEDESLSALASDIVCDKERPVIERSFFRGYRVVIED